MDRKKIIMKSCLDQIFQLFDDILLVIPNDSDILAAKVYVGGIKQANPKLILSSWYNTVTMKYKEQIDKGDFDFDDVNDQVNIEVEAQTVSIVETVERVMAER